MTKKIILLVITISLIWFFNCCKNKIDFTGHNNISVLCLGQKDSILYVKISNFSGDSIFVPGNYFGLYTENEDTIHLEAFENPVFDKSLLFLYKNEMPFKFYVSEKIKGIEPDSIINIGESVLFNQFRVDQFIGIPAGKSYIAKIIFTIPRRCNLIKLVYYKKRFKSNEDLASVNYFESDFVKFNDENSNYVVSSLYVMQ